MDFFDKVKNVASDLAEKGGRKSKELYGVAKLKIKITEKQGNVKNLYKEIGYNAYKAYKEEKNVMEAISEKLSRVDELESEIAALRDEIEEIKKAEAFAGEKSEAVEEAIIVDAQQIYDEADKEPLDSIED